MANQNSGLVLLSVFIGGYAQAPTGMQETDFIALAAKLAAVRKSTKVGSHTELRNRVEGGSIAASYFIEVPNDWAVAYERIVKAADLEQNCDFQIERGKYASAPLAIIATDLLNLKPLEDPAPFTKAPAHVLLIE